MNPDQKSSSENPSADLQQPHSNAVLPGAAGAKADVAMATDKEISKRRPSADVPPHNGRGEDDAASSGAGQGPSGEGGPRAS